MAARFNLPIITLASAKGDIAPQQLGALKDACQQHGFFLLSNKLEGGAGHLIDPAKLQRMWQVAAEVFDAPLEAKRAVAVSSSDNNRGYFSANDHREINKDPNGVSLPDSKEGFFFGSDSLIAPGNRLPQGKAALLPEVEDYMRRARDVCVGVMRSIVRTGLLANLPPEQQTDDGAAFEAAFMADPVYMLKVLKYATGGVTDAHTDYGCITLLLPGDDGLQVHYGGQWNPVPLVADTFVVNLGDLLQFWSGARVKSTIHRVIFAGAAAASATRYSIPFFLHPARGSAISNGVSVIDSYEYVLDRFDRSYKHRQEIRAAQLAAGGA